MNTDNKQKDAKAMDAENELYFPEYIKSSKEEDDPETIDYKGADTSAEERELEKDYDDPKKTDDDYNDNYMNEKAE